MKWGQSYIDRSQEQQHFLRAVWDGNFLSPVREALTAGGAKVLDVCCGSGVWVCDNASDFKNAKFFGFDIVQRLPNERPRNVEFQVADVLQRFPFDDDYFDFVYIQFITLWFTEQQIIDNILPECVRVLKPGGWIEISDSYAHLYTKGQLGTILNSYFTQQQQKRDFNPFLGNHLEFFLQKTGNLQNIRKKEMELTIPNLNLIGNGMGDIACKMFAEIGIKSGMELGLLKESDSEKIIIDCMREAHEKRAYFKLFRVYAEKTHEKKRLWDY
ncbi:12286_t:CDS:2 [Ambispora gerdemannii]|uniref:12286_t:CDS:1 n=1 Tax=Ambispora gerdemannii TaxID=144530 RepID=A0A9N9G5S4_9GLOM|nr:12286_t:CDS:2 [Ambispora gerdemannii]